MIKKFVEEEIHDKVISELLKSEDLKTAAVNNSREDFAFPCSSVKKKAKRV